jgi:hypothetical protein
VVLTKSHRAAGFIYLIGFSRFLAWDWIPGNCASGFDSIVIRITYFASALLVEGERPNFVQGQANAFVALRTSLHGKLN